MGANPPEMGSFSSLVVAVLLVAFPSASAGAVARMTHPAVETESPLLDLVRDSTATGLSIRSVVPQVDQLGDPHRIVRTLPYPDVDRDGVEDVLEVDLDLREAHPIYGFVGTLRLNTLSGRSGELIGRYSMPFDSGVPQVVLARLGEPATTGALVTLNRLISSPEHPTAELVATAVSADGKEVWSRQIVSTSTSTPTRIVGATDLAVPGGLLDAPGGQASDLLVNIYDYAGAVLSLTPAVIDGATGELREHTPIVVPWVDSTPAAIAMPDIDADPGLGRRDDILVVDTTGTKTGLMALSSSTGEQLWHDLRAPSGNGLVAADVRDATGDPTHDFVLGAPARLVDGSTGDVIWTRSGGPVVTPVGRADQDEDVDILAMDGTFGNGRIGASIRIISSRGKTLGRSHFETKAATTGLSMQFYEEVGDVDGDRVDDVFLWLIGEGERHISVDGASGRSLLESKTLWPLKGSILGGSGSLVDVVQEGARFVVTPRTARGEALWQKTVAASKNHYVGSTNASEGALLLTLNSRLGAVTYKLDGRTGSVVWSRKLGA